MGGTVLAPPEGSQWVISHFVSVAESNMCIMLGVCFSSFIFLPSLSLQPITEMSFWTQHLSMISDHVSLNACSATLPRRRA